MSLNDIIAELQALRVEMEEMKKEKGAARQGPAPMQADEVQEEAEDDEDQDFQDPSWGNILRPASVAPAKPAAQFLCQVMSSPPPLIS